MQSDSIKWLTFLLLLLPVLCLTGCPSTHVHVHSSETQPNYNDEVGPVDPEVGPVDPEVGPVDPELGPVDPEPAPQPPISGSYVIYLASFTDFSKLDRAYNAIKDLEKDDMLQIVASQQPNDRSRLLRVNYSGSLLQLTDAIKSMCRNYGLELSFQSGSGKITITE